MKTRPQLTPLRAAAGFTLIEMIGVLALMAIVATVLAPNALRALDRAAVSAENQTLNNLGDQIKLYLQNQGTVPAVASWTTAVGTYADMSPTDIATNKRNMARVYLLDPAASPTPRILLLSSMRKGLALPASTDITTAAQFQQIWQTADGAVPPTTSWAGWSAWSAVANSGDFLVIDQVNLLPTYNNYLQTFTVTLNNPSTKTVSYNIVLVNGTSQTAVNIVKSTTAVLASLLPKEVINMYTASNGSTLNSSYVISTTGKTFSFDGTNWTPQ